MKVFVLFVLFLFFSGCGLLKESVQSDTGVKGVQNDEETLNISEKNLSNQEIPKVKKEKSKILNVELIKTNAENATKSVILMTENISDENQEDSFLADDYLKNIKDISGLENEMRANIVKYALSFNGKKKFSKTFNNDCSGFVSMVFNKFDYKFTDVFYTGSVASASMVQTIYIYTQKFGNIFKDKTPKVGDLIFFDNTHDRNKNRKVDDKLTHIGIVIGVEPNGTVHYIHHSSKGVNIQIMNIQYPDQRFIVTNGKKEYVNSYLRARTKKDKSDIPIYSGEMFRAYGSLFNNENISKK